MEKREEKANKIIRNYSLFSMRAGLIPVPIADMISITGSQMRMINKLAKNYGVKFSKDKARNIISSIIGGGAALSVYTSASSILKIVPILGPLTGTITMAGAAGVTTYALGKIFMQHFESGGTFLDFNTEKVKSYYKSMIDEGKRELLS